MENREIKLGFKPQKELKYNTFLPYSEYLDDESNHQLAEIKANLGLSVQNRDIKTAATHWTGQLAKYMRLYGQKFSKEDHIVFIKLLYELICIPELDYSLVSKFSSLLVSLLKKKELLTRDELTLPWRPLFKLLRNVTYSQYEHHGLVLFPQNIETVLKNVIRVCRVYFPLESTQEMLDEWRPLMCLFDVTMVEAMYFFEQFLPTKLMPEQQDHGYKLWFNEFLDLWDSLPGSHYWEKHIVNLFSRLTYDTIGQIDWKPYVPKIFTCILRSLSLPVGSAKVHINRSSNSYDVSVSVHWIVNMMGGPNNVVQSHLDNFWKALESFYHPSNYGRYTPKLLKFLQLLTKFFVRRVHRERREDEKGWDTPIPETHRLTNADITAFVTSAMPILLVAMFSKLGPQEAKTAFQQLAALRPELVIPPLLERTYPALETLTEPHRLVACLHCLVAVSRPMLVNTRWYPEGRSHVLPILNLCLPGIDPNDIKKTMATFQIMSTFTNLVPIVDCSDALHTCTDLTEIERELCSATAQFEDFVCQFMDRIFALIDNSAQDHIRADSTRIATLAPQEQMIEVGLLSTFNGIVQQSSVSIYDEILRRLFRFVSTNVYEFRVAGRFTSHLLKAVVKTDPKKALKTFMRHFSDILINRCSDENIAKLEELDHEILWNLKLMSELVRCNGKELLEYLPQITQVLTYTLHVKCKDGAELACTLLQHTLRALTLLYTNDFTDSPYHWKEPLTERLPIREWGRQCGLDKLQVVWHVPNAQENAAASELLTTFLLPELDRLKAHVGGEGLERSELKQRLQIVNKCLAGAASVLPIWKTDAIQLVESNVLLTKFDNSASADEKGISLKGKNARVLVAETIRPLLAHMLATGEDDTKSFDELVKIYSVLMFYNGTDRSDLDTRWKALRAVKKSMENKLYGKKAHMIALLVDRIQLQHELRVINRSAKLFTALHRDLFHDLFTLSTSRYSEVRKVGQSVLGKGLHIYAYSYRALIDTVVQYVNNGDGIEHHQYKGALYVLMGDKHCLMTKRNWEVMSKVWPAVINGKHSEKPSIIKLLDTIITKLHKHIETTEISITVHNSLLQAAECIWTTESKPSPAHKQCTDMTTSIASERQRNSDNARVYNELVHKLVDSCNSDDLNWKHYQMALELLKLLTRHDIVLPPPAVTLLVQNLTHVTLQNRKISLTTVSAILKAQKRRHTKIEYDPYAMTGIKPPSGSDEFRPGNRKDNTWHHYNSSDLLDTKEKYENAVLVEKTHWGYYTWPKTMKRYAPISEQPPLGRTAEQMTAGERAIFEAFNDDAFVGKVLEYLQLEEHKGKDKFHSAYFTLFKGLFRNYDSAFLPLFRKHMERLVAETSREKHEYSHRLAAEIIAGVVRGSKHWDYDRVEEMWQWLTPLIKKGLSNMSVECVHDWGTAFATASESRDPRKLHHMFELLIDNPMNGEGGTFGDESRLYVLQGALAQQEWRVPGLLHKAVDYIKPHLAHNYKSLRDRLGSFLVTALMCDVSMKRGAGTTAPLHDTLIAEVMPQLAILRETQATPNQNGKHQAMEVDPSQSSADSQSKNGSDKEQSNGAASTQEGDNGESEERKTAVRLSKTVMKYLQGSFTRNFHGITPPMFQFLPILCVVSTDADFADEELEDEIKMTFREMYEVPLTPILVPVMLETVTELCAIQNDLKDEELKQCSMVTLAFLSHSLLSPDLAPQLLDTVDEVASMRSWHARAAILCYLQVTVFCNLFLLQDAETKQHIEHIITRLLCDEQLEVRQTAAETLGGMLHCGYFSVTPALVSQFEKLARTGVRKKKKSSAPITADKVLQRHAGVLGLCACVQAYPYDVPEFVPQILMTLSSHLDDPQPIQMTVKKTLSNFKRTHYDNWHDHKQKFTDDQLVVLTDLLVSPSYYA